MLDKNKPFVGFHTRFSHHEAVDSLIDILEKLAPMGYNALVLELNPGYSYRCYPEYSNGTATYEDLQKIAAACKRLSMKAIPLIQCLSHQCENFGSGKPWPLIYSHPEFCERRDLIEGAKWPELYCHSWCASNDDIYKYFFPMMDEIIEAMEADVVHIGLDEAFEIGEDSCPRCKGKNRAELFARTVKILHDHLAEKNIETMMWGDRLLDAKKLGYQMWEADVFGMYPAFDMEDKITRDIIITDWHYDMHSGGYPSVGQFMEAGFYTIASFGAVSEQAAHFWKHCLEYAYMAKKFNWEGKLGGILMTHWGVLTEQKAQEILGGIDKSIGKGENPWASSEVGRCIADIQPKIDAFLGKADFKR